MHVHLDGDILVYRCGFACENQEWDIVDETGGLYESFDSKRKANQVCADLNEAPDMIQSGRSFEVCPGDKHVDPVENVLHTVRLQVEKIMGDLMVTTEDMTIYLSGETNFRDGIATIKPYKGNRDPDAKPVHRQAIKDYMARHWTVVYSEDEEADDLIAYTHYGMWLEDERSTCICTLDKDLNMVPGMHYNFVKEDSYYVTEEAGIRWFYTQLLTGDATDNIPGISGTGPKRAAKVLDGADGELEMYRRVRAEYEEAYPDCPDSALIENARLLWMRRSPNEWWNPPEEEDNA